MRMMLVGAGAVGESILRILQSRENHKEWLDFVLVADYDLDRAKEVVNNLENISKEKDKSNKDNERYYTPIKVDARNKDEMIKLIKDYKIDFVMDGAAPFVSNQIFDAAYEGGANYGSMGTWSVPMDNLNLVLV